MTIDDDPLKATAARVLEVALGDGRQSAAALAIARGVGRVLRQLGHVHVSELTLASGRRADIVALARGGDIWIVEIKSSVADFRADQKWPEYWDYADHVLFAVAPGFPVEILPDEAGLILADRYGGEVVRMPEPRRLAPARRKAMQLAFARTAALRLAFALDPDPSIINLLSKPP